MALDGGARAERRADPRALWPEVRSIVLLGLNYGPRAIRSPPSRSKDRGAISVYARNRDYHDVIKGKLKERRRASSRRAAAPTSRSSSIPRR